MKKFSELPEQDQEKWIIEIYKATEAMQAENARLRKCLSEMLHYYEEQIGMEGQRAGCDDEKRVLNVARKLLKK